MIDDVNSARKNIYAYNRSHPKLLITQRALAELTADAGDVPKAISSIRILLEMYKRIQLAASEAEKEKENAQANPRNAEEIALAIEAEKARLDREKEGGKVKPPGGIDADDEKHNNASPDHALALMVYAESLFRMEDRELALVILDEAQLQFNTLYGIAARRAATITAVGEFSKDTIGLNQALEEVPYHHQQKDRDRYTQVKKNSTSEASMNLTKKVAQDLEDACPLQVFIAIFSSILSGTPHLFNTPLTHLCLSIAGITGDDTTICVGAGNSQKRSI